MRSSAKNVPQAGLLVFFLVFATACTGPSSSKGKRASGRGLSTPNIILISIDTLRSDHMSLYGYERPTTPFLEKWARQAVVFEEFSQNGGGTLPSHTTMLTSLYPRTHRVFPARKQPIPESWTTLAEHLRSRGYQTGGFVDCIWLMRKFGFSQGFDQFDEAGGHAQKILPRVIDWLNRRNEKPLFLFLHLYDVHSKPEGLPYHCPEPFFSEHLAKKCESFDGCRVGQCATRFLKKVNRELAAGKDVSEFLKPDEVAYIESLYDLGIQYIDDQLRSFFKQLADMGINQNSLIVVTADHGENFFEHGRFLHSLGLYDTMTQVPLIIRYPGGKYGGVRVSEPGSMVDLAPTILEIAGLSPLEKAQGRSLVPTFRDHRSVWKESYIWEAIRTPSWKYVKSRGELFDLRSDPGEQENLAPQHPELVEKFDSILKRREEDAIAFRGRLQSSETPGRAGLSAEEQQQLEALGYLSPNQDHETY